jgi:hypothetical protein
MTRLDSRLPIGLRLRYYYKIGTFTSGELQVECCVDFHHEGCIWRGEWYLHRLRDVGLAPGGSRAAKPRGRPTGWSGLHWFSPPTQASPPRVDAWQPRLGLSRLKSILVGLWLLKLFQQFWSNLILVACRTSVIGSFISSSFHGYVERPNPMSYASCTSIWSWGGPRLRVGLEVKL